MTDKLELKDILGAIDMGAKEIWDELTDEQRKSVSFFLLNRYVSNVKTSSTELQEHFVLTVNEFFNKNHFVLSKHPKLLWQLLCMCSHESKKVFFHEWIGNKKKTGDNKITNFLSDIYPNKKRDEIELLSQLTDKKECKRLAQEHGYDDKQIEKMLK